MAATALEGRAGRVWDPLVRITHWSIAAAVLLNGLLTEEGSLIHIWVGYAALSVLALRLLWGFIGPSDARFSAFSPSLSAARAHLDDILAWRHRRYPTSHTPLGSLMAYALWAMLLATAATGVAMESAPFPQMEDIRGETEYAQAETHERETEGPEDHHEDGEREGEHGVLGEIHETAANLLLILAALHVAGVALETRLSGENLVGAMAFGRKRGREDP